MPQESLRALFYSQFRSARSKHNDMKLLFILIGVASMLMMPLSAGAEGTRPATLAERLKGRILIQVQSHGEAFYVDPVNKRRHYMGRPVDAFILLTKMGVGIRHQDLQAYLSTIFPETHAGKIFLDVEQRGEAYYVDPVTRRATYLGTPAQAFALMREKGLGITSADLAMIPLAENIVSSAQALEKATFNKVNEARVAQGRTALVWDDAIAKIARDHSARMANGSVAFGHDGFDDRVLLIRAQMNVGMAGENVALNSYDNPVKAAVDGWLASQGHRENIMNIGFDTSGIGIAKSSNDTYYFTQIFVDKR